MKNPMPLKGDHVINLRLSWELKSRIHRVAENEHRSVSEVCRVLLLTALPIFEGIEQARERALTLWQETRASGERLIEETSAVRES